jgi:hypothetical protein
MRILDYHFYVVKIVVLIQNDDDFVLNDDQYLDYYLVFLMMVHEIENYFLFEYFHDDHLILMVLMDLLHVLVLEIHKYLVQFHVDQLLSL